MQVNETLNEGLKREFTIVVPASEIDAELNGRLAELAPQMSLPGFRPGKVPPALLRARYGDSLLGEILEKAVNTNTEMAMNERGLRPAVQPKVEITAYDKGKDLEYTVSIELMPEIDPIDFASLSVERTIAKVDDKAVTEALERMAAQQKDSEPVADKRGAAEGDVVVIDFEGKIDGTPFDGGAAQDHHLELGSNSFIPGFEGQLVGAEVGESRDVTVSFPDDYQAAHLAGKEAVFSVTVKELRAPKPVSIDDALAQRFGLDSLDALRDAVREQMQGEFAEAARAKTKRSLLDALADRHSFAVPAGMLEEEYRGIVHQVVAHGEGAEHKHDDDGHEGHDHEGHDHHDHSGHPSEDEKISEEERAEYRQIAERRVRLGLLLSEVGRVNNIQVTDDEVTNAIRSQAARFPGQEKFVFEYYQKNPQALAQVRAPLFEDKVVDFILEMATVTDKEVTPEQLFADDEADAAEADDAAASTKTKKKASDTKAKAAAKPKKAKAAKSKKEEDAPE
ncbi:trigger factor [Thalassobaculum sp.]|uniref:trigger factor n=1 Tax=Thalassobaculum sp. TaxID=2022740 RepID=UPI0032ECB58E